MRFSPSKLTLASVFIASTAINSIAILPVHAQTAPSIVVASTTSTEQSGLFAHMLPEFKKAAGIDVKVVGLNNASRTLIDRFSIHDRRDIGLLD